MKEGRILKTYKGFYYVWDEISLYECRLRGRLKKERPDILTGDIVTFEVLEENTGIIEKILPRYSRLFRPAIANIDQVLLITSIKNPDFSNGLLDRFLIQISKQDLDVIICMTKMDLAPDTNCPLDYYEKIGYPVYYLSLDNQSERIHEFEKILKDKTTVLAGPSGVGKSSLLQTLIPQKNLQIGEVSEKIGRGRHTTKHTELLEWNHCLIADTPGFTSLNFKDWKPEEVKEHFPDFYELSSGCKYRHSCLHQNEPDCAVKEAVSEEKIPVWRYESYLSILNEIKNLSF